MKKLIALFLIITTYSCSELQQVVNQLPGAGLSNDQIATGLKEALDQGIDKQVSKLTQEDGFYKNDLVKIILPEELQKVDKTLRKIGLSSLADEGLKVLNRAAENAVKEGTPIFANAVKEMTFNDAKNILMGPDNAATLYLEEKTSNELYSKFNPVIKSSLDNVGATQIWSTIIKKYNALPLTVPVNTDLPDYVTGETMQGVFTMIAFEENKIRNNISSRSTALLQQVFALQD
ncbi:Protein of unknown function [Zhouia amylolytica]|uniref:DUF4197 domain-containing protein n=2 Tax=Zhouia amylolytica TaxID=376730 RepID=W2UMP3_9FLAO|nr:DUF4197 domain-containing protein [Zhouia amylolytica]ETN95229.1 hypothetical protein P278_19840 [Zhouia amylolytica AD3]MCQ0111940.1 DUF4197 domain-containing protein [Zhouia amylolytica]SFS67383.1 Protein of unknown function [Zhouia amylolytica]